MIDNWKIIDEDYLNYLRSYETRIPLTDYGTDHVKPFFGALFEIDNLVYVTQISSAKERHKKLKNTIDFHKYYMNNKLIGVVNLNYMFPVPNNLLHNLIYSQIEKYRSFNDNFEKNKYINFLKKQLVEIQKLGLEKDAQKVYQIKDNIPSHPVARRSFDFHNLEKLAKAYVLQSVDKELLPYKM